MKKARPSGRKHAVALLPALASLSISAVPAHAVGIGPVTIPLKVAGVPVDLPVTADLDIETDATSIRLTFAADGGLEDLQAKALAVARALPLPKEDCARDGLNVVVGSVDASDITPAGDQALVVLDGKVTVWACGSVLGVKGKTSLQTDTARVSIPVEVAVIGPHELGLKLAGPASIAPGSKLTDAAARVLIGDIDAKLTSSLSGLLEANTVKAALPPILGLDLTVERAELVQKGTALGLHVSGKGSVSGAAATALVERLEGRP